MAAARPAELAPPSALDLLATRALDRLEGLPDVTRVGLAVSEGGRRQLLFTASERRADDGLLEWCHIDATADVPLIMAVSRGELVAGRPSDLTTRFPAFARQQRDNGVAYVAAVPVLDVGEPLGGFVLYYDRPQELDVRRRRELVSLGARIGAALSKARRDHRRLVADVWEHDAATRPSDALHATHQMPGDQRAVGGARRWFRARLAAWDVDQDRVDDAVLCLTELATNAVVHTHAGCQVHVQLAQGTLSVRVIDHGGLGPVRLAPTDGITAHGRGLGIVRSLSTRMGWDPSRRLAWFELDLPR